MVELDPLAVIGHATSVALTGDAAWLGNGPVAQFLPCWGDADNLVDRFDARLLLDGPPSSPRPLSLCGGDGNEAALDEQRYADLHAEASPREEEEERRDAEESGPTGDEDQFAWSYEGEGASRGDARRVRSHLEASASALDRSRSWMPGVELPSSLSSRLPETLHAWDVMVKTADAVRSGGGPMEMVLRVRQSGKPLFAFLRPEDELHELFRWLVATPPEQRRGAGLGEGDETAWSAKQEVIMRRSARKVQEFGLEFETLLRAKQSHRPEFAFLDPAHSLHGKYRHLAKHPGECESPKDTSLPTDAEIKAARLKCVAGVGNTHAVDALSVLAREEGHRILSYF